MLSVKHFVCCSIDIHKNFVIAAIAITDYHGVTSYLLKNILHFQFQSQIT